jgi:hypothetical protein
MLTQLKYSLKGHLKVLLFILQCAHVHCSVILSASLQSPFLNRTSKEECPHSTIMTMIVHYSIEVLILMCVL